MARLIVFASLCASLSVLTVQGKGRGKSSSVAPKQMRHPHHMTPHQRELQERARAHRELQILVFGRMGKKAGTKKNQVEEKKKFTEEEPVAKGIASKILADSKPTEMFAEKLPEQQMLPEKLPAQQVPNWQLKEARRKAAADYEASSLAELQMFLVIVIFGTLCLGYLSIKGPDLVDEVEIPGLGTVNLKNAAQNLFPGGKKMSKFDDIALMAVEEFDNGNITDKCGYGSYQPVGTCGGVVVEGVDSMLARKTFVPGIDVELESGL